MTPADLKRFELLSEFSDEDRDALFELLEQRTVRKGRSIYRETSEADEMILVASGQVVLSTTRSGEVGTLGEGAVLGVATLLTMARRAATAKAAADCSLLALPRTSYRRLLEDHPRTACRLTEGIATELAALLREGMDELLPPDLET